MKNIKMERMENATNETDRILANVVMTKRLNKNIERGNVTAIKLEDLWK
ncbi:MAG TPA: hypothetical protein VIQ23_14305 [Hanamia sp.]